MRLLPTISVVALVACGGEDLERPLIAPVAPVDTRSFGTGGGTPSWLSAPDAATPDLSDDALDAGTASSYEASVSRIARAEGGFGAALDSTAARAVRQRKPVPPMPPLTH